jgi:signal transduction histidine kinase
MSGRALTAFALAGVAVGLYEAGAYAQGGVFSQQLAWTLAMSWVYIGAGLVAWRRRPANRLGCLLTVAGFAWLLPGLQMTGVPVLFALGFWFLNLPRTIFVHLILAFPSGRLSSRWERLVVGMSYGLVVIGGFVRTATYDPSIYPPCPPCTAVRTANALLLYSNQTVFEVLRRVLHGSGALLSLIVLGMVIGRWRMSSGPTRRALAPVWFSAVVFAVAITSEVGRITGVLSEPAREALVWFSQIGRLAVPIAFLVGLLRMRLAQAAVGELVIELGQTPPSGKLQEVLARALKDPSLQLVFWLPEAEHYVDLEGRPVQLPSQDAQRAVTLVQREGQPLAAMIHDQALADECELVQAVAAAARLGLENERLQAEVRAQLEEVRTSRARIVAAADAERRRVERNLHDGAQQRLVSLSLSLSLTKMQLETSPNPKLRAALDEASDELQRALSELRDLARGIHPAILTQQGLGAALESLAEQAPLPVTVVVPDKRYPTLIETTAYFMVCEALTNITKYAQASAARITIHQADDRLIVEITDDGIGGADPARGSGLRGLVDRVAALGGRLRVESPPGRGTCVRAELPCG